VRFRQEIERILDMIIPQFVGEERLIELGASEINEAFDWGALIERLFGPPTDAPPQPVSYAPTLWD
jgi:hypothetical protein